MLLHLILGSAALLAAVFTVGLLLAIIGIQRGDHGKRLTGRPDGLIEAFARRLLTGSRGCDPATTRRTAPMSRITDLSAAVVVSARHCNEPGCDKCRARSRWLRRKCVALPQVPEPLRPRPEEVMSR